MNKIIDRLDKIDDRTSVIFLIGLFLVSCVVRIILTCYPKSIWCYPDELRYLSIARSIMNDGSILIHNLPVKFDYIFYPFILAPFTLITDTITQINVISAFNAVLFSSIVFPVYFLSGKIIKNRVTVLMLLITVQLLPDLTMSMTFMSENLYYPLSLWLFLFIYNFWDCRIKQKKMFYIVIAGLFCFMTYITKIVAVGFIFGFAATFVFDMLTIKKDTIKQNIRYGAVFILILGICFLMFKLLLQLKNLNSGIEQYFYPNIPTSSYSIFIYFIYSNIFNFMFALIAFFYFPVIYTFFYFKSLDINEKKLFVFAIASLLCIIAIISGTISINEDYPKIYMRQHARYYAPLLVPFLILFFKQFFNWKSSDTRNNDKIITLVIPFSIIVCIVFFILFRFFSPVNVDGVLLNIFIKYSNYSSVAGDANQFMISPQLLTAKAVLILYIALFTFLLFSIKYRKKGIYLFYLTIIIICIFNNIRSIQDFRKSNSTYRASTEQAVSINDYITKNGSNCLVITRSFNGLLDTYVSKPVYSVSENTILSQLESEEFIDLKQQMLLSIYPQAVYKNLTNIDYIITDGSIEFKKGTVEQIKIPGVRQFSIYKNKNSSRIYPVPVTIFPAKKGKTQIIEAWNGFLLTQHPINNDGDYVSSNKNGALIYGPYCEITAGVYDFSFYYEYSGKLIDGQKIGTADVYLGDIDKKIAAAELYAGKSTVTLRGVNVPIVCKKAETRIFTNKEKLKFIRLEVTKIK